MRILTEGDIIRIMREEYEHKVADVLRELDLSPFPGQASDQDSIIAPDLKVKHKKTGLLYTVDSVSPKDIILRSPEGDRFQVGADEFEKEYALD